MVITSQNNHLVLPLQANTDPGSWLKLIYFAVKSKRSSNGWLWIALPKSLRGDTLDKAGVECGAFI